MVMSFANLGYGSYYSDDEVRELCRQRDVYLDFCDAHRTKIAQDLIESLNSVGDNESMENRLHYVEALKILKKRVIPHVEPRTRLGKRFKVMGLPGLKRGEPTNLDSQVGTAALVVRVMKDVNCFSLSIRKKKCCQRGTAWTLEAIYVSDRESENARQAYLDALDANFMRRRDRNRHLYS